MVEGADRRVRHRRHRHRVWDIARAQRTGPQLGEHHLRGGRRVERHHVGARHGVPDERRLEHRRCLVVEKRPHRAARIRRQLRPEVVPGVRRSDRIEHGAYHELSPDVLRHLRIGRPLTLLPREPLPMCARCELSDFFELEFCCLSGSIVHVCPYVNSVYEA